MTEPRAGDCTGRGDCSAWLHVHGCYADFGACDSPNEHPDSLGLSSKQRDEGFCCLTGGCCGPGSWCCKHANSHSHTSDGAAVFASRPLRPKSAQEE